MTARTPSAAPFTPRSSQAALAVFAVCVVGLLVFRTYSPRLTARPTDALSPQPVARAVDLNTAGRVELLQLPGVGPGLADAILTHRSAHGRFEAVSDLYAVPGIGEKTLDRFRPYVGVSESVEQPVETLARKPRVDVPTPPPAVIRSGKIQPGEPKIDVNAAGEAELMRLPRIGPVLAGAIVAARQQKRYETVDDLRRVRGIGAKTLDSLRPFVTVGE